MATVETICQFDPSGRLFAVIASDGRVKLWDVATRSLHVELSEPSHLGTQFTSLAWSTADSTDDNAGTGKRKSKKAKKGAAEEEAALLLAVGSDKGAILLWNVRTGQLVHTLGGSDAHQGSVTAMKFSRSGGDHILYSVSEDKQVIEWDVGTGSIMAKWKGEKFGMTAVDTGHGNSYIATASSRIKVWDLASKEVTKKFTGHASQVKDMVFDKADKVIVSCAQDRFLSVWELKGKTKQASHSLVMSSNPRHIELLENGDKQKYVLGVGESGNVEIFDLHHALSRKKDSRPPVSPKGVVSNKGITLGATFVGGNAVVVAHGSLVRPHFAKLMFLDEADNSIIAKLEVVVSEEQGALLANGTSKKDQTRSKAVNVGFEDHQVLGPLDTDMNLPNVRDDDDDDDDDSEVAKEKLKDFEASLEEKIRAIDINYPQDGKVSAKGVPKADSVQSVLVQALHSNDNAQIEYCLAVSDPRVIQNTVQRLPAEYVMPFLTTIVSKFQAKPGRGTALVAWIRAILVHHASYLMTLPDMVKQLSGLYQVVDSRLSVFKKLLKLSGRLDLILSQVNQSKSGGVQVDPVAANVYEEDEDDDEEEGNGSDGGDEEDSDQDMENGADDDLDSEDLEDLL